MMKSVYVVIIFFCLISLIYGCSEYDGQQNNCNLQFDCWYNTTDDTCNNITAVDCTDRDDIFLCHKGSTCIYDSFAASCINMYQGDNAFILCDNVSSNETLITADIVHACNDLEECEFNVHRKRCQPNRQFSCEGSSVILNEVNCQGTSGCYWDTTDTRCRALTYLNTKDDDSSLTIKTPLWYAMGSSYCAQNDEDISASTCDFSNTNFDCADQCYTKRVECDPNHEPLAQHNCFARRENTCVAQLTQTDCEQYSSCYWTNNEFRSVTTNTCVYRNRQTQTDSYLDTWDSFIGDIHFTATGMQVTVVSPVITTPNISYVEIILNGAYTSAAPLSLAQIQTLTPITESFRTALRENNNLDHIYNGTYINNGVLESKSAYEYEGKNTIGMVIELPYGLLSVKQNNSKMAQFHMIQLNIRTNNVNDTILYMNCWLGTTIEEYFCLSSSSTVLYHDLIPVYYTPTYSALWLQYANHNYSTFNASQTFTTGVHKVGRYGTSWTSKMHTQAFKVSSPSFYQWFSLTEKLPGLDTRITQYSTLFNLTNTATSITLDVFMSIDRHDDTESIISYKAEFGLTRSTETTQYIITPSLYVPYIPYDETLLRFATNADTVIDKDNILLSVYNSNGQLMSNPVNMDFSTPTEALSVPFQSLVNSNNYVKSSPYNFIFEIYNEASLKAQTAYQTLLKPDQTCDTSVVANPLINKGYLTINTTCLKLHERIDLTSTTEDLVALSYKHSEWFSLLSSKSNDPMNTDYLSVTTSIFDVNNDQTIPSMGINSLSLILWHEPVKHFSTQRLIGANTRIAIPVNITNIGSIPCNLNPESTVLCNSTFLTVSKQITLEYHLNLSFLVIL